MPQPRLAAAAVLLGGALACAGAARAQSPGPPRPPAVLVALAEEREVAPAFEFVGRVRAVDKVDLRARVTGFLGERLFAAGDEVRVGQIVLRIDPAPFQALVDQRRASVSSARAALQLAQLQVERGRELLRSRSISQATLDDREAAAARAQADVELAEAGLREAEINLSYTSIASPIEGRIGEAAVSPGNLVGPDTGVLATVVRQTPVHVTFSVTQRQLIDVRRNAGDAADLSRVVARLRLADGSTYGEAGTLDFLGVTADSRTDSIPVRAVFPNPRSVLADGMSVRVIVEPRTSARAIVIPQAAIAFDQRGAYVLVVDEANKVVQRRVRAENRRDGTAVVREGLGAGERVIVQGQARVRPGLEVAPSPAPAAVN